MKRKPRKGKLRGTPMIDIDPKLFKRLCNYARRSLASWGWDPADDPERDFAVVDGVWAAMLQWHPGHPLPIDHLVLQQVRDRIRLVEQRLAEWERQDRCGAERGQATATPTPVPMPDREILTFVALHGRTKAAKLLGMSPQRLRDVLDEIAFRIRRGQTTIDP